MLKILRILFCVVACLCVASAVFVGIFLGWQWCLICIAVACLFAVLMNWCRNASEKESQTPDFMNTPEENERIRDHTEEK
jgi:predicted MFS family arabinose efflux permease